MNDSLELALTIGNPTDQQVVEALWAYCHDNDVTMADPRTLAGYMVAKYYLDEVDVAIPLVEAEVAAGRIQLLFGDGLIGTKYEGGFAVGLDDLTRLKTTRRYLFWLELNETVDVHLIFPTRPLSPVRPSATGKTITARPSVWTTSWTPCNCSPDTTINSGRCTLS